MAGAIVVAAVAAVAIGRAKPSPANDAVAIALSASIVAPGRALDRDYRRLLVAMLAVEYWAEHDYPPHQDLPWKLPTPTEAIRELSALHATEVGTNTRQFRAYHLFKSKFPDLVSQWSGNFQQLSAGESATCAAPVSPCLIREATPDDPEADIYFALTVAAPHTEVAVALDPQDWDNVANSSFATVQRTMEDNCPPPGEAPVPADSQDVAKGSGWQGTLFEHFEVECENSPEICISLKHTLCFDTEFHPTNPVYRVSYEVCPALTHENWIWGGPKVQSGFAIDDGCTYADSTGDADSSEVGAIKRLKLTPELCGAAKCDYYQTGLLAYGLKVLAIETSIALSQLGDGEEHPCETFTCKEPDHPDEAFLCNMFAGFNPAWRCGN